MKLRLLLPLGLLAVSASAQTTATPESVGMSSERLGRLSSFMADHVDQGHMAGGLSAVYRRGELVHFETYGDRDRENGLPMNEDTIFRIYSMSKIVTAVAVMMLYEEGHYQLSTPVADILPEFADACVYDAGDCVALERPMTVEHLLTHTAGLTYGEILGGRTPVDSMYQAKEILWGAPDLQGFVEDLASIPLLYQPGEEWHYSVSIDVLGRIVEVASGMTFEEFLEQRLFGPLGMVDSGFSVAPEDSSRLAIIYQAGQDGSLSPDDWNTREAVMDVTFFSGGGGLLSTAPDYMRFARMLLNGGEVDGVRVLGEKTVELMMQNHLDDDVGYSAGYGFGLGGQVVTDLGGIARPGSVGAFSWSGAANTYFFVDPAEELIGFAWTQLMPYGHYEMHNSFRIAVYQAIVD